MRIIAGHCKGMKLQVPAGRAVRPTSDLLRGAIMSMLGGFFEGERVLDLCAGTGAVALEFISRGCARAVVVENDAAALELLVHNIAHTRQKDKVELLALDVLTALEQLRQRKEKFELIYFDPPYVSELYAPVLQFLHAGDLLAPAAEVIVESHYGVDDALLGPAWQRVFKRRYGSTTLERFHWIQGL